MGEQISGLGVVVEREERAAEPTEIIEKQGEAGNNTDNREDAAGELPSKTFEENIAEVEAYFGGRVFTFQSHSGTAAAIAEMCPMAKMVFHRGAEFAISFLEKFDETDELDIDEETDGLVVEAQPATEKAPEKRTEARTDTAIAKTVVAQVAISAVMQEHADPVEYKPAPLVVQAPIVEKARVAEKTEPSREVIVREIEATPLPLPTQKAEVKPKQSKRVPVKKVEQRKVDPQVEKIEIVAREVESPIATETHKETPAAEREAVAVEQSTEPEIREELVVREQIEQPQEVNDLRAEPKIELEQAPPEATIEMVNEVTVQDETEDEIEESEPAIDLYETIADELGIEQDQSTVAEAIADQTELETTTIAPLLKIIEEIAEQPEEKQPVIKQRLVEVVRSIEILKWARSAEECKEAVDGLRANLTLLLEELGYDEPELLTIQLLEQYNIQSIDEVMNTALKIARSKKSHSPRLAHIRQLLIGRHVVKLLVGTLSHRPQLQYMSA
jgi:hypothetical protein